MTEDLSALVAQLLAAQRNFLFYIDSHVTPYPVVGDMHLNFEVMELRADPGLSLLAFSADAGSSDDDALRLLANWAATHDSADALKSPTQT